MKGNFTDKEMIGMLINWLEGLIYRYKEEIEHMEKGVKLLTEHLERDEKNEEE